MGIILVCEKNQIYIPGSVYSINLLQTRVLAPCRHRSDQTGPWLPTLSPFLGGKRKSTMRILLLSFGLLSLGLGIAGVFLPILPTTPFLLLTAFCFSKCDASLHQWLLRHPLFGPVLRDWTNGQVIRPQAKAIALLFMTFGLAMVWLRTEQPFQGFHWIVTGIVVGIAVFLGSRPNR